MIEKDLCDDLPSDTFDLVIADIPTDPKRANLRNAISVAGKPAILAAYDISPEAPPGHSSILELSREPESWE